MSAIGAWWGDVASNYGLGPSPYQRAREEVGKAQHERGASAKWAANQLASIAACEGAGDASLALAIADNARNFTVSGEAAPGSAAAIPDGVGNGLVSGAKGLAQDEGAAAVGAVANAATDAAGAIGKAAGRGVASAVGEFPWWMVLGIGVVAVVSIVVIVKT